MLSRPLVAVANATKSEIEGKFQNVAINDDLQNELFKIVAWMPTYVGFRDEFLFNIKLKCLAAP